MVVTEAVDATSLLELRKLQRPGTPDVVGRILNRFFEESTERVASLHAAVATDDGRALERTAHALKGIAGTVGAHEVGDLAVRLEHIGREGRGAGGAAELVSELEAALARARATYQRVLELPGGPAS